MSTGKWKKPTGIEQTARHRDHRRKVVRPQDTMLADFLRAPTAEAKRRVIEAFAPHYFVFGTALNPQPTKENDDGLQTSL
jgi:hypothetical protein